MSFFAPTFNSTCATAPLAASLGGANSKALRNTCFKIEGLFAVALAGLITVLLIFAANLPWDTVVTWSGSIFGVYMLWSFLGVQSDNASDLAFKNSGLSKSEWLNMISADSRTRFTVMASLISAIIVSLNAWITRWENNNKCSTTPLTLASAAEPSPSGSNTGDSQTPTDENSNGAAA